VASCGPAANDSDTAPLNKIQTLASVLSERMNESTLMKKVMAGFLAATLFGAWAQTANTGWSVAISGGFCAASVAGAVAFGTPPPAYVYSRPVVVYSAPVHIRPAPVLRARFGHTGHHHFRERGCW